MSPPVACPKLPPGTKIEMAELIDGPLATFWREKMLTWLAIARAA